MENKRCLIIATHFDDDYLMFGSFLVNYPGDIYIVYTHQSDCISDEIYDKELAENDSFLESLGKYRKGKGYGICERAYCPKKGGVSRLGVTEQTHFEICDKVQTFLEEYRWEYYLYSCNSIHQNHQQSHVIAESLLRVPYIFSVEKVLIGTYDPECMFPVEDAGKFCIQRVMSEEDVNNLIEIGKHYVSKLEKFPEEQFRKILSYNGLKIRKAYAQSFATRHIVLSDNG
jgi:hypothetical protein